jgi:glycosyltransferase involved in cell wall biosynthesis
LHSLNDQSGWEATLAGDGEVDQTRAKIAALGMADRVRVHGWANPADVIALEETHDVMVLPSFNENLPMSVIEGMACGMAVIATPVGAVPDIIKDGQSGLLVPPGDVAALAATLSRCISDVGLRHSLGICARAYHSQYLNLDDYAQRVVAIWKTALPVKS